MAICRSPSDDERCDLYAFETISTLSSEEIEKHFQWYFHSEYLEALSEQSERIIMEGRLGSSEKRGLTSGGICRQRLSNSARIMMAFTQNGFGILRRQGMVN